jgi:hypothetical protein
MRKHITLGKISGSQPNASRKQFPSLLMAWYPAQGQLKVPNSELFEQNVDENQRTCSESS